MQLQRFRSLLLVPALALIANLAPAQSHTADFDGNAEGSLGQSYVEDGLTFSDLDRYLGGSNETFVAEDASTTLAGFPGYTPSMTLGFGGYSPGGGVGFSRCGHFKITPPAVFNEASLHVYVAGGGSGANTVTLEATLTGSLVASDQFSLPTNFGPHHFELSVSGASFDLLRLVGAGPDNSGAFFAVVDSVIVGDSAAGVGYCFGDPGVDTPCPCVNDNDGSVPGSGCANGVYASGAKLVGAGSASLSADSLVLSCTGLEPLNSGLYFQADNDLSPGAVWGDGLRCAGGALKRLGVRFADGAGASDTSGFAQTISAKAGNISAGDTKYYQCWYRTTVNPPCGLGVNDFNTSNGYAITWQP